MSDTDVDDAANDLLQTVKENYSNDLTRMGGSEYYFKRVGF